MAEAAADCAAFDETVVFLSHFNDLKDPRQQGKVDYPLEEILLLCLIAVLVGAETITDIALFEKVDLLQRRRDKQGVEARHSIGARKIGCPLRADTKASVAALLRPLSRPFPPFAHS